MPKSTRCSFRCPACGSPLRAVPLQENRSTYRAEPQARLLSEILKRAGDSLRSRETAPPSDSKGDALFPSARRPNPPPPNPDAAEWTFYVDF